MSDLRFRADEGDDVTPPHVPDETQDDGWGDEQPTRRNSELTHTPSDTMPSENRGRSIEPSEDGWGDEQPTRRSSELTHAPLDPVPSEDRDRPIDRSEDGWGDQLPLGRPPDAIGGGSPRSDRGLAELDAVRADTNAAEEVELAPVDDSRRSVAETIDGNDDPVPQSTNDVDAARQAVEGALLEAERSAQPITPELEFTDIDQNHEGHNAVFRLELANGEVGWFKPMAGEDAIDGWRQGIPDESGWKREVAAFQLDDALGLGVVPETTGGTYDGLGVGSIQRDVPRRSMGWHEYSDADIDRMAIFDYISGNSDRHSDNYRTDVDGGPKATDNGFCFPESSIDGIKSDFVVARLNQPLDDALLTQLRATDDFHVSQILETSGVGKLAAEGVLERLREIRSNGMITGRCWTGRIVRA